MTPIREQVLNAITQRVDGRYGVTVPEDERDVPITMVNDDADEPGPDRYDVTNFVTPVTVGRIEMIDERGERDGTRAQAHYALAQIVLDMYRDEQFGGLVDGIDFSGGLIQPESKFVFAEGLFRIRWHHVRGNPFRVDPDDE